MWVLAGTMQAASLGAAFGFTFLLIIPLSSPIPSALIGSKY